MFTFHRAQFYTLVRSQVDPDLVKGREKPKKDSYEQKYGKDESERMVEKLENSFAEVGIKYNHEGGEGVGFYRKLKS